MATKTKPHRNHSNLSLSQAMHGKNSSSAASPMSNLPKRLRNRAAIKKHAISNNGY